MADPGKPAAARSAALAWGLIASGLAICALTTWFAPDLVGALALSSDIAMLLLFYLAVFLPMIVVAVAFARIEGFSAVPIGEAPGRWLLIGSGSGLAGLAITALYAVLARAVSPGTAQGAGVGMLLLGLIMILFQTGAEEVLFRGWLQRALLRRIGPVGAIALAALLFGAFHVLGGARNPISLLNLALGGVWFGLLAWRSGGLVAPLAAHFAWNATEELALGLSPNPATGSFGALFDWDLVQAPLWGGTEEGLNSSIGMTVVLIALVVPLLWRSREAVTVPAAPVPHPPGRAAA